MKFALRAAALLLLSLVSACATTSSSAQAPGSAPVQAAIDELLAADRGFAAGSAATDSASGLSAMLDDDVTLYAVPIPGFATGKARASEQLRAAIGAGATRTGWTPVRAGLSADGRHGFTFGYMTTTEPGKPDSTGKYVSYWVKRPQGWRVALYKRLPSPGGAVSLALLAPAAPSRIVPVSGDRTAIEGYRASLAATEKAFSDDSQDIGLDAAFVKYGRPDAVNGNLAAEFVVGNQAIGAGHPSGPSPLRWSSDGGVLVASSGDLGVSWGLLRRNGPTPPGRLAEIPFFTIWQRASPSDPWRYVAE
jgi:ketosteroid isomerase-like protein